MPIVRRRIDVIHYCKNFASSCLCINILCINSHQFMWLITALWYSCIWMFGCPIHVSSLILGVWIYVYFYIASNVYLAYVHEKAMEKKIDEKDPRDYHGRTKNLQSIGSNLIMRKSSIVMTKPIILYRVLVMQSLTLRISPFAPCLKTLGAL